MNTTAKGMLLGTLAAVILMFCLSSGTRQAAADPEKDSYTYRVVNIDYPPGSIHDDGDKTRKKQGEYLEALLNKEAADGWEYHSSTMGPTSDQKGIFRKRK